MNLSYSITKHPVDHSWKIVWNIQVDWWGGPLNRPWGVKHNWSIGKSCISLPRDCSARNWFQHTYQVLAAGERAALSILDLHGNQTVSITTTQRQETINRKWRHTWTYWASPDRLDTFVRLPHWHFQPHRIGLATRFQTPFKPYFAFNSFARYNYEAVLKQPDFNCKRKSEEEEWR